MKTEKMKSRWRYPLVLAIGVAAVCGFGYWRLTASNTPSYMTAPVTRGSLEQTVLASGTMEANNLVSVGAQVSGQIEALKVTLGDRVTKGQPIAQIDSLPQQNSLRNKTAALNAIRAEKAAKEATLHQVQLAYARQLEMLHGDAGSREDFENAEASLKVTRAEIAALDAQIEQASIEVDTARINLGYTKITSPVDGVVVAIVTKEGQTVNANQSAPTIIKVANLERMTIKVEISEADVVRVKPGQPVKFTILGEPDTIHRTTLSSIEPAPESISNDTSSSKTTSSSSSSSSEAIYYLGILDVPNHDGKLRISMTAEVNIVLAEAKNVLLIPSAALGQRINNGKYLVQVEKAPGQISRVPIEIGLNNNVQAEARSGLAEGQRVVIGDLTAPAASESTSSRPRRGPPPGMM